MAKRKLGIGDRPITGEGTDVDLLGIGDYAAALREFIGACDTPLTVGLQGDWGSGKTSLMLLIRKDLGADVATAWVNAWKYAQIGEPETLFVAVLQGIVDEMEKYLQNPETVGRLRGSLRTLGSVARRSALGVVQAAGQTQNVDVKGAFGAGRVEPHQLADQLKKTFQNLIGEVTTERERVVLFIDDLDRIPPIRAVQILEALKNFLDIPGLVTVLACDYAVISRGLSQRTGISEKDLGRSFFDKIIQVPFRMPTHAYTATTYVKELLRRVDVQATDDEVVKVTKALRTSVGLNPRTLKRHANTLLLLMKVAGHIPELAPVIGKDRRPLIMLSITAMEAGFPQVHRYLARQLREGPGGEAAVHSMLTQGVLPHPDGEPWVRDAMAEGENERRLAGSPLRGFLDAFFDIVNTNEDDRIDQGEMVVLRQMMLLSAISSVDVVDDQPSSRGRQYLSADELENLAVDSGIDHLIRPIRDRLRMLSRRTSEFKERRTKTSFPYSLRKRREEGTGWSWYTFVTLSMVSNDGRMSAVFCPDVLDEYRTDNCDPVARLREFAEGIGCQKTDTGYRGEEWEVNLKTVDEVREFTDLLEAVEPLAGAAKGLPPRA